MSQPKLIMLVATILVGMSLTVHADPYADVTASRRPVVERAFFGMHFHRLVLQPGEREKYLLTRWPDVSVGSIRLWDSGTRWADIVPSPGQWHFERMDTYVEQATVHRATILYTLGSTPKWASSRQNEKCSYGLGCAAEPVRMAHWEEYVRRVAQRYRGRIAMYELWNEPYFSDIPRDRNLPAFFSGSIAQMVEMARIARKVLDEVDPSAMLSTPGFVNGPDRLEMFLSNGGKQYVQAISYHFYAATTDQMVQELLDVRAIMKRQGVENLPLWNTETGLEVYPSDQPLPPGTQSWTKTEAALRMAQLLILGAAAGLEHYYYYAWDNVYSGMISPAGVIQPSWESYAKVHSWLLDATMLGCESIQPNGVQCQVERGGQRYLIVWAKKEKDEDHTIRLPLGLRAVSIEKLFSSSPQAISMSDNLPKLMLGSEPVRILLESKQ